MNDLETHPDSMRRRRAGELDVLTFQNESLRAQIAAQSGYTPLGEHPLTAFPSTPAPNGTATIGTLRAVNVIQR